ncbi:MAG: hypothetical protein ABH803_00690 [Candidatus Micrarchaeota archaeon]
MTEKVSGKEWIFLVGLGLIIFTGIIWFSLNSNSCKQDLDGLSVFACNPVQEFREILSKDSSFDFTSFNSSKFKGVIVQLNLDSGATEGNSVVAAVGAEIVNSLVSKGRNTTAIGVVDGKVMSYESVPFQQRQELLGKTAFIISKGECNCLKTMDGKIYFEGDSEFMMQHLLKLRGIISLVLSG